jgi:Dehydratase large subunit
VSDDTAAKGDRRNEAPGVLGRMRALDGQPVNLDGFAAEDHDLGLVAFRSRNDPEPSLVLGGGDDVVEMDGVAAADFDILDAYIAAHGIDSSVAAETAALDDLEFARRMVDPGRRATRSCGWRPAPRRPSSPGSSHCCARSSSLPRSPR